MDIVKWNEREIHKSKEQKHSFFLDINILLWEVIKIQNDISLQVSCRGTENLFLSVLFGVF